jgi:molybdopterin/thiamine biosynthesis adenylyltransferase
MQVPLSPPPSSLHLSNDLSCFIGVLGPVPGLIGTLQAVETIKLITANSLPKDQKGPSSSLSLLPSVMKRSSLS